MVQRYRPLEATPPEGDGTPEPPSPDLDDDVELDEDREEEPRRGFGLISVLVVIVAMLAGLVVFTVLTGLGERLLNGGRVVAVTATVAGTAAAGTVGAAQATATAGTLPTPRGPALPPAPAPAADVPAPPNSELITLVTEQQSPTVVRANARYQSQDQRGSIQDFYDGELPRRGWSRTSGPTNGLTSYQKVDDGIIRSATVQLTSAGAGTTVVIQVTLPRNK